MSPAHRGAAKGVPWVANWPCGQSAAPQPECHRRRNLRTRREAGVTGLDCGAGVVPLRAFPFRLHVIDRSRVLALFLRCGPNRGMEGWNAMTHTDQDPTARR